MIALEIFHSQYCKINLTTKNLLNSWALKFIFSLMNSHQKPYTVKLTRAKLPANAGNFTCRLHVKKPHTQFTYVTCTLPVKTGKFTRVYAVSTSRRINGNCLQPHVNLPECNGYFTGNFICGTHANLPVTSLQNCLLLQGKVYAIYRQKHQNRR